LFEGSCVVACCIWCCKYQRPHHRKRPQLRTRIGVLLCLPLPFQLIVTSPERSTVNRSLN
jgi:hypothetical protein